MIILAIPLIFMIILAVPICICCRKCRANRPKMNENYEKSSTNRKARSKEGKYSWRNDMDVEDDDMGKRRRLGNRRSEDRNSKGMNDRKIRKKVSHIRGRSKRPSQRPFRDFDRSDDESFDSPFHRRGRQGHRRPLGGRNHRRHNDYYDDFPPSRRMRNDMHLARDYDREYNDYNENQYGRYMRDHRHMDNRYDDFYDHHPYSRRDHRPMRRNHIFEDFYDRPFYDRRMREPMGMDHRYDDFYDEPRHDRRMRDPRMMRGNPYEMRGRRRMYEFDDPDSDFENSPFDRRRRHRNMDINSADRGDRRNFKNEYVVNPIDNQHAHDLWHFPDEPSNKLLAIEYHK